MTSGALASTYGAVAAATALLVIAFYILPWWLRRSAERDALARQRMLDDLRGVLRHDMPSGSEGCPPASMSRQVPSGRSSQDHRSSPPCR